MVQQIDGYKRIEADLILTVLSDASLRNLPGIVPLMVEWCKDLGLDADEIMKMDIRTAKLKFKDSMSGLYDDAG